MKQGVACFVLTHYVATYERNVRILNPHSLMRSDFELHGWAGTYEAHRIPCNRHILRNGKGQEVGLLKRVYS